MPITTITIGEAAARNGVNLTIPCPFRAQVYLPFVETCLETLRSQYSENPLIARAIETPRLWQWLAEFLDQDTIYYIEKDLEKSLTKPKGTPEELQQYYQEHTAEFSGQNNYGGYLLKKFSKDHYPERIKQLTQNFIDSVREALDRVIKDMPLLDRGFLFDGQGQKPQLTQIIPTGSDLHKQGRQVFILQFSNSIENIRVVYKPSSVLVDMMLFGNTTWLQTKNLQQTVEEGAKVTSTAAPIESLAERFNQLADTAQLPTYNIFPCEDVNMARSYGYMSF